MSNLDWQTSDGVTLKSLRQSAGIGLSVLARKASLSVEQLKQLEDGGSSLFYTEAIKLRAGERVLSILGFRFTDPQPKETVTGNTLNRIVPLKEHSPGFWTHLEEVWVAIVQLKPQGFNLLRGLGSWVKRLHHSPFANNPSAVYVGGELKKQNSLIALWQSTIVWVMVGSFASALLIYDLCVRSDQLQAGFTQQLAALGNWAYTTKQNVYSLTSTAIPSAEVRDLPGQSSNRAFEPKIASSAEPLLSNAPSVASPVQSNTAACHWQDESPSLSALHPSKEGNFVHIMASTATSVCVMDKQNKVSVLSLLAGASQSVYGTPPFKIYSENLKQLKFYFQGYGIYMPDEVSHQFTLTEISVSKQASIAQTGN